MSSVVSPAHSNIYQKRIWCSNAHTERHVTDEGTEASCKWRDAQRAMRNRQFIGYTLGAFGTQFYN